MLSVKRLSTTCFECTNLRDVTFEVREGEVLGIAGVEGNGQRQLVEALTGLAPIASGSLEIAGRSIQDLTPGRFTDAGGGVVTEDRRGTGLALTLPIVDNLMLRQFASPPFARQGLLDRKAMRRNAEELLREFDIRCPGIDTLVGQLSGGNQQKVMLAREMYGKTRLLIAAQPTRGLDVGAIEQVYKLLNAFKSSGGALLLISAELDEIFTLSDRIAVMSGGRLSGVLSAEEATVDGVGELMLMADETSPSWRQAVSDHKSGVVA
jgi:simple sugar transport system ATP-binding protein